jgi:hypothetical protein
MITMGSPYCVWINTNEIISSCYLLDAVCVTPPASPIVSPGAGIASRGEAHQVVVLRERVEAPPRDEAAELEADVDVDPCPRRKPPFWAVKRPARPYKSAIQNGF